MTHKSQVVEHAAPTEDMSTVGDLGCMDTRGHISIDQQAPTLVESTVATAHKGAGKASMLE